MCRAVVVSAIFASVIGGHAPASAASPTHPAHPAPSAHRAHPRSTHAAMKPAALPQLNIAIGDGQTFAAVGDRLTYTITIRNLGTAAARELQISQSLPAGLAFVSSDHGGRAHAGQVSWKVDLKPGGEITVATVGRVGATPDDLLRLASVACATAKGDDKPLVCATHSDLLAAGAAAHVGRNGSHRIWYAAGAAAVLLAGLATFVVARRRRLVRAGR
jgi:uncharacterized repeat protein (TIGR01451 family)